MDAHYFAVLKYYINIQKILAVTDRFMGVSKFKYKNDFTEFGEISYEAAYMPPHIIFKILSQFLQNTINFLS